jgi:hypothetical protein
MDNVTRDISERQSLQNGEHLAFAANLSRNISDLQQPIAWKNTNNEPQSGFLDMNAASLYASNYPILAQAKVFEQPATQAVEPMPPITDAKKSAPDAAPVMFNIQVTNVPEVSPALRPDQWLHHMDRALAAGAAAVRPTEAWLAKPHAVHDSLIQLGPILDTALNYYANNRPQQVASDAQGVFNKVGDALDKAFSLPHTADDRAKTAGTIMPLFFFEGRAKEPMHPETAQQLGLEKMSEQELEQLGIKRYAPEAGELNMPEVPEHLKHLPLTKASPELLKNMAAKGRIITLAEEGSEAWARLKSTASSGGFFLTDEGEMLITLRQPATKISALEEFLHGSQARLGITARPCAEIEVKDFMLRHARLLGLSENDSIVLQELKREEIERFEQRGYKWLGD